MKTLARVEPTRKNLSPVPNPISPNGVASSSSCLSEIERGPFFTPSECQRPQQKRGSSPLLSTLFLRQSGLFKRPANGVIRDAGFSFCREIVKEGDNECHIAKSKSRQRSLWSFKSRSLRLFGITKNNVLTELKDACNGASLLLRLTAVAVALTIWTPSSTANASTGSSPAFNPTNAINAIIGEAEGEPLIGKIAIAEVIRNKGNLRGVYGINSPRVRLASLAVRKDCELAWAKKGTNLTRGATVWGSASDVAKWKARAKKNPKHWFNRMHQTAQIGHHYFFKQTQPRRRNGLTGKGSPTAGTINPNTSDPSISHLDGAGNLFAERKSR